VSRPTPPCGTEAGYQHHRYRKQRADDACKAAHAAHKREHKNPVGDRRACPCGTVLRTEHTHCSKCRRKRAEAPIDSEPNKPSPARWVRRGLVWYPVYEQSEVA